MADAPEMQTEREVAIYLLDVNDNTPRLITMEHTICVKDHKKPVLLQAEDGDAEPFGPPFTFSIGSKNQRSPNWEISPKDGEGLGLRWTPHDWRPLSAQLVNRITEMKFSRISEEYL